MKRSTAIINIMIKHNLNDTFPQKYREKNCKNVGKTCFILSKKQDNVFEKHIYILTKKKLYISM